MSEMYLRGLLGCLVAVSASVFLVSRPNPSFLTFNGWVVAGSKSFLDGG